MASSKKPKQTPADHFTIGTIKAYVMTKMTGYSVVVFKDGKWPWDNPWRQESGKRVREDRDPVFATAAQALDFYNAQPMPDQAFFTRLDNVDRESRTAPRLRLLRILPNENDQSVVGSDVPASA